MTLFYELQGDLPDDWDEQDFNDAVADMGVAI